MQPIGMLWIKTLVSAPPNREWFFAKFENETLPTIIINSVTCISVRFNDKNELQVIQHAALPPEWRQ